MDNICTTNTVFRDQSSHCSRELCNCQWSTTLENCLHDLTCFHVQSLDCYHTVQCGWVTELSLCVLGHISMTAHSYSWCYGTVSFLNCLDRKEHCEEKCLVFLPSPLVKTMVMTAATAIHHGDERSEWYIVVVSMFYLTCCSSGASTVAVILTFSRTLIT